MMVSPISLNAARCRDLSAPSTLSKRLSSLDARAATEIGRINMKEKAAGASVAQYRSVEAAQSLPYFYNTQKEKIFEFFFIFNFFIKYFGHLLNGIRRKHRGQA